MYLQSFVYLSVIPGFLAGFLFCRLRFVESHPLGLGSFLF